MTTAEGVRRIRHLLPARAREFRRPVLITEIAFIGISYSLYTLTRNTVPAHEAVAVHRAHSVLSLQHRLHIDIEHTLNHALDSVGWLAQVADYYYATMHLAVTVGVLAWLYFRHPLQYRGVRTALYVTNLVALAGFWLYALAPPRLIGDGFVDTVVQYHTWGSWGSNSVDSTSNQYAAMPSLHVGWSLWCAIALIRLSPHLWVRILGALYPVATFLVIVSTANHFVLDAIGGAVAVGFGFLASRLIYGRSPFAEPVQRRARVSEVALA